MRYVKRAEWGAVYGRGHTTPRPQSRVVFHHAPERTLPDRPTHEQISEQIRIMEQYHVETWTPNNPRISYNWIVVEQTGDIYEGIGWDRVGAHVGGHNTASLGVLILGVDGAEETGSDRTWRRIATLVDEGIRRGSLVERPELSPHRRYRATSCPGDVMNAHVEMLTLEQLFGLGVVAPDYPEPLPPHVVGSVEGLYDDTPIPVDAELIEVAKAAVQSDGRVEWTQGLDSVWKNILRGPVPPVGFKCNGCTASFDKLPITKFTMLPACIPHDYHYSGRHPGMSRWWADTYFMSNGYRVLRHQGCPRIYAGVITTKYFTGAKVGGHFGPFTPPDS